MEKEKRFETLGVVLKYLLKNDAIALKDTKRSIGNMAKDLGEEKSALFQVLGPLYLQAVAENFEKTDQTRANSDYTEMESMLRMKICAWYVKRRKRSLVKIKEELAPLATQLGLTLTDLQEVCAEIFIAAANETFTE